MSCIKHKTTIPFNYPWSWLLCKRFHTTLLKHTANSKPCCGVAPAYLEAPGLHILVATAPATATYGFGAGAGAHFFIGRSRESRLFKVAPAVFFGKQKRKALFLY